MMHHQHPFDDDLQESVIPYFGKNGTTLSQEERIALAKRRGVCLTCGRKTHQVKVLGRTSLTNDDIYQGKCIRCNPQSVPPNVLQEWQSRNPSVSKSTGPHRFRTVANAARLGVGLRRSHPPPPPEGVITAEVSPVVSTKGELQREGSSSENSLPHGDRSATDLGRSSHHKSLVMPSGISPLVSPNRSTSDKTGAGSRRRMPLPSSPSLPTLPATSIVGLDSDEYRTPDVADSWTLMKEIKESRDWPDILRTKLHGYRNLADDQAGAMYEIKDVMDKYRNECRLMMVASGAVWGICSKSDDKKQESVSTGCLDIILASLHNGATKDDPDAIHWAMGTLSCLAELDENKQYIASKGGLEIILRALFKHKNNPTVFEWACRALYTMVHDWEDSEAATNFELDIVTIEEAKGIHYIVSAMKDHVNESVAQWWALKLLFRLLDRIDPAAAEHSVKLMNDENLCAHCMNLLKARSTSPVLFIQACEMMSLLVTHADNPVVQQTVAGCIPTVARIMGEHSSNLDLHESSARLLASMATGNQLAKKQIFDGSGARSLLDNIIGAPANLGLQQAGLHLFFVLSSDERFLDVFLPSHIKQAIEKCSDAHPYDEQLNAIICGLVANMSAASQARAEDIPVDLLLRLSTSNLTGTLDLQVSRTLANICSRFPTVASQMVGSGLCDRLLEGLCDSSVEVQSSSASSLAALASQSEVGKNKIVESSGLGTASAALFTTASEPLAEKLLVFVSILTSRRSKKAMQLPNEAIQAILHSMRTFPGLNKTGCTCIRNTMLVSVPRFKSLNTDGLVDVLCGIIDGPSSDETVIEACGALWSYTAKQTAQNSSVASQLFRCVLGLCARHKGERAPFNSPILLEASGALASIMYVIRENPIQLPDDDIDLIISILDTVIECDVENVDLMENLLDVILTLCFLSKELLIQFGVIVVVIDCMVEHEAAEKIQEKGCAILALLASTENLQVNLSIAETDGIDMIVSALAAFTGNLNIQTDACRALSHLSIDHESRMLISSQGGLILLVNATTRFSDETDILEAACSALLNLSSDAEEQVLSGSNVVETVINIMRTQVDSSRLQETCLGVLQNISMRSRESKRGITDAGGIGAITFAIKEFMGSPSVLERAFTALWSLAVLEDNQNEIANEGGISMVINGMMANLTCLQVQKQACGCLCALASNSRNKTLIRDLGGVDAIVYAMWGHYNSDSLLVEACRALSNLAVNVQTNEVMIASEGEINAIVSAMRRFPHSERLQEHACVALRNFLLSADNAAIVSGQAMELEQLMNSAASRFPGKCGERARQVIASLR